MTLIDILGAVKKRLVIIMVLAVLAAAGAGAYAYYYIPNQYVASTTLFVFARDTASSGDDWGYSALTLGYSLSDKVAEDVADLVSTEYVQDLAAEDLDLPTIAPYAVRATTNEDSRMVYISATATDPDEAIEVADSVARTVIDTTYAIMRVESVRVIDEAQIVSATSMASKLKLVGIAFAGTFIAASAVVIFAKMLDARVRDKKTAEAISGISVLGEIPELPCDNKLVDGGDNAYRDALDAARVVMANLNFLGDGLPGLKTIVVTSSEDSEARHIVSYLLAQAIAQDDRGVLLMEYDCRDRKLARALDVSPGQGIGSILSLNCASEQAICRVGMKKLFFLDAEGDIPNPTALLATSRFKKLVEQLSEHYSFVIINAPSLKTYADASLLASICDATILVARSGDTRRDALSRGAEQLQRTGTTVAGIVLTRLEGKRDKKRREKQAKKGRKNSGD